ncbi:hypothetical protein QJS10_CPB17g01075 [Acorus calamus]|uniref:Uncharacterized protein n=1 Tax=Acorus calamus TaxID=4465 RepID=A0AAV9CTW1_ACOCL|nr:hypothetical protein QJS10_CPB17g01075 [Acorus calamus]
MDDTRDECKDSEVIDEELKHGWPRKTSPNLYLNCLVIDRTACSTTSMDTETNIVILSEDQIAQLLSSFWVQANLPDNLPGNFQAIAHSFSLTLISSRMKVDPYLHVSSDMQLHIKPQVDVREYGSLSDQQSASSTLSELRKAACESDRNLQDIIVQGLANILDDFQRSASTDDDTASESSVTEIPQCINKLPGSLPLTHIISVGQLLESALQVAGQVAGTSVSTSPLPYSMMASQCEAHGSCTRKKLSSWLGSNHEPVDDKLSVTSLVQTEEHPPVQKLYFDKQGEPWRSLKLPPASPFDNFLKAVTVGKNESAFAEER